MVSELAITMTGADADELRSLRNWLVQEDELRGHVVLVSDRPAPGTLGSVLEALSVSVGWGGAISVLLPGTVAWLRQRYGHRHPPSTTRIKIRRPDGTAIEISAATTGAWSPADVVTQVRRLTETLESGPAADPRPEGAAGQDHPG